LVKTREKFITAEKGYHYPTTKTDLNKDISNRYSDSYSLPKKTNFSNIASHEPPTKRTTIDHTSNTVYSVANIDKIQERIRQALGETR
jgi:adenosylmethionine-8-amino-7-oxononanoate aminotransferase